MPAFIVRMPCTCMLAGPGGDRCRLRPAVSADLQGSSAEAAVAGHYLLRAPGSAVRAGNASFDQRAEVCACSPAPLCG